MEGFPDILVQIDNMKIVLDADDLIIPESLKERTVKITFNNVDVTGRVEGGGALTSLSVSSADMKIESPLSKGDRVIIASTNNGQRFILLDKV